MTRAEILAVARTQTGIPWMHQAHTLGVGLDCLGFIVASGAAAGSPELQAVMARPELWAYGREPNPEALFVALDEYLDRIPSSDVLPADVALMRMPKWPMHFGFIGEGDTLIHCSLPHRRVVEHRLDEGWRARIVRAYRIRGVT